MKHHVVSRLAALGVLALVLGLAAACGGGTVSGQPEAEVAGAEEGVSGEFVGRVEGAVEFVAVVANEPGEAGGEYKVRAYVCDGS